MTNFRKWQLAGVLGMSLAIAGCGSLSVDEVEQSLRDDFSARGGEVTWILVEERADGTFYASFDVEGPIDSGDDEDETHTFYCDISGSSSSTNRSCNSSTPGLKQRIIDSVRGRVEESGGRLINIDIERNADDPDIRGTATAEDPRSGRTQTVNVECEVDRDDGETGTFTCNFS